MSQLTDHVADLEKRLAGEIEYYNFMREQAAYFAAEADKRQATIGALNARLDDLRAVAAIAHRPE